MSPLRAYRCEDGHEVDVLESMDGPRLTSCPTCGKPVEPVIQSTQRPIVKGGTRLHHGTKGVK